MSAPRSIWVAGFALAVTAGFLAMSPWTRAAAPRLSREALASAFDADMRHVIYEWDPADPRPRSERRQALFDFIYETYDASAWIPQSVFDGNLVTHAVVGDVDTIVGENVGLVLWRDNSRVKAFGMAPNVEPPERHSARLKPSTFALRATADKSRDDDRAPLRWTVNCLVCHTAEIDGVAYLGAGTKVFDDLWLGEALKRLTSAPWRSLLRPGKVDAALAADANRILHSHHHDKIDSLTRARSTAFAASHVELYMRPHNGVMPTVDEVGRGDVKTPPLWHTAAKMPAGRWYTDGSFHGPFPLMASSMELEKDRPFDALVQVVVPTIKAEFASVIRHLRPPRYPYAIDRALAARGRELFDSKDIGCARCHGVYDGQGNVEWPGVHADVGTDRARLDVVSDRFIEAFNGSPIAAEGALVASHGYAATPLTGVWANYPYLHNGSVPTLYHLLGPVSERPGIFHVMAARRLDRERVGQPLVADPRLEQLGESEWRRRFGNDRDWFNASRPGSGNGGHDVWPRIRTDANRRALIEYLKTL
jgi:processive rubber oxygenase RoxA-like protein